jgi:Methyltransferase domain
MPVHRIMNAITRRLLEPAMDYLLNRRARNIELQLQFNALESTAAYIEQKMSHTLGFDNKYDVLDCALKRAETNGLFMEFGVYKGESINSIAQRAGKTVHGFDSFEGLPEFWRDGYPQGKFSLKAQEELPSVHKNVELHVGWFHETLPGFAATHPEPVSFMHIDCDLYTSTKVVFDVLGDRIQSGTILVFDEYFNLAFWQQYEYKAFQELVAEKSLTYDYLGYTRRAEQVAVRIL